MRKSDSNVSWNTWSVVLHLVLFALVVWLTPARELLKPTEKKQPEQVLSRERLETMAEKLNAARVNELLRQLEAMQAVLHNMDVLKTKVEKDYDTLVTDKPKDVKVAMLAILDAAEASSAQARKEHAATLMPEVEQMLALERQVAEDESKAGELVRRSWRLDQEVAPAFAGPQAAAQSAVDRLRIKAQQGGYRQSEAAAELFRDAQLASGSLTSEAVRQMTQRASRLDGLNRARRTRDETARKVAREEAKLESLTARGALARERLAKVPPKDVARIEKELARVASETAKLNDEVLPGLRQQAEASAKELSALQNLARMNDTDIRRANFETGLRAEEALVAGYAKLRKTIEEDVPVIVTVAPEVRVENELVSVDTAAMSLADAYDLAKQIEQEIVVSYKDLKAAQTAIEKDMSFQEAQRLTDVAQTKRMDADRAVLESPTKTKEALDAKKTAQAEVLREANAMVDTVVALMEEAFEIAGVKSEDGKHEVEHDAKAIPWLEEEKLKLAETAEATQQRLKEMASAVEYKVALSSAAGENESEKAKDLSELMKNPSGGETGRPFHGALPNVAEKVSAMVGGNVFSVKPSETVSGAQWAYVRSWYVIGPFPNPNRMNLRRQFAPESVIDLDAVYPGKDGKMVGWKYMQARAVKPKWGADSTPEVVPEGGAEYEIWYAYADVVMDEDCDRWIAVGSDDRSDIWINDLPVWASSDKLKSWRVDEGFRKVHFKKGHNKVLARIENGWHALGWSMSVCLTEEMK